MQQPTNYQLNQWDPEDRILRTDFNTDNAKIDAALKSQATALAAETAARESSSLYVKLLDVTTEEATTQADFDVSGIDFTQYAEIKLYLDFGFSNELILRINNLTSYTMLPISGDDRAVANYTSNYLAFFDGISTNPWAFLQFNWPRAGSPVRCICITARGQEYYGQQIASTLHWNDLKTFNILNMNGLDPVPAGIRFVLYGLKL